MFSEGLAAIRVGSWETGKWGFIDKSGKMVINPQFDYADNFKYGITAVRIGDEKTGKIGFIDKKGHMIINPIFNTKAFYSYETNDEGLIPVATSKDNKKLMGYISR